MLTLPHNCEIIIEKETKKSLSYMKMPSFNFRYDDTFVSLFCAIACFIFLLVNFMVMRDSNKKMNRGIRYAITEKTTVAVPISVPDRDTVVITIPAGDTVSVLGYELSGSLYDNNYLYVETSDGTRGYMNMAVMGWNLMMSRQRGKIKDAPPIGDTLRILTTLSNGRYRVLDLRNDSTYDVHATYTQPLLPDSIKDMEEDGGYVYMSKAKLERRFIGRTLAEADSLTLPMRFVAHKGGQIIARSRIRIFDPDDGNVYSVRFICSPDGVIQSYDTFAKRTRNRLILKYLPWADKIVDQGWLAKLIEEPIYETFPAGRNMSWVVWGLLVLLAAIYGFFGLLWQAFIGYIPMFLAAFLIHYRYVYYPLSDTVLTVLLSIIGILGAYAWGVMILIWGSYWWFVFPAAFFAFPFAWAITTMVLNTHPHTRCIGCRRLNTMSFETRTLHQEYDEWRTESKRGQLLSSVTDRWQTWTQNTVTRGGSVVSSYKTNVQNHSQTTDTYRMHDYEVLYHVKIWDDIYRCSECGQDEHDYPRDEKELDRRYVGSHTESVTY